MMYNKKVYGGYTQTIDNREMTVLVLINEDKYDIHLMEGAVWSDEPKNTYKTSYPIETNFVLDEGFANHILGLYMVGLTTQKVDFFTQGFMNYRFTHNNKVSYSVLSEAKAVNVCLNLSGNRVIVMDTFSFDALDKMYSNEAVDAWRKLDNEMVAYLDEKPTVLVEYDNLIAYIVSIIENNKYGRSSGELLDDVYDITSNKTCIEAMPTDSEVENRLLHVDRKTPIVNFMGRLSGIVSLDGELLNEDDSIEMILESSKLFLQYHNEPCSKTEDSAVCLPCDEKITIGEPNGN